MALFIQDSFVGNDIILILVFICKVQCRFSAGEAGKAPLTGAVTQTIKGCDGFGFWKLAGFHSKIKVLNLEISY